LAFWGLKKRVVASPVSQSRSTAETSSGGFLSTSATELSADEMVFTGLYGLGGIFRFVFKSVNVRGSIQFTNRDTEIKTGLCTLAVVVIVVASIAILIGIPKGFRSMEKVDYTFQGLEGFDAHSGSVYLLDIEAGTITHVGRFLTEGNADGVMSLTMPEGRTDLQNGFQALYWRASYETYAPYFNFINDVDLRERLNAVLREVFNDSEVRVQFQELLEEAGPIVFDRAEPYFLELRNDIEIRNAFIDLGIEQLIRWLAERDRTGGRYNHEIAQGSGGNVSRVLGRKAAEWPWGDWFGEVFSDPEMQAKFSIFINSLEPYMRASLNELLWTPSHADGTKIASVRLLWVTRRALFGGREAAITLIPLPKTERLSESGAIQVREAL